MDRKRIQVIKDVASKTAGLVFFSLLAIALGVAFGVMFERWVGGETGTPTSTNVVDMPIDELATEPVKSTDIPSGANVAPAPAAAAVKYRVRVGPYTDYTQAAKAAEELRGQGYPVFLANQAPFLIQVGAFANQDNALSLKEELTRKGYTVAVQPD